ncbi:MAG: branched-chain amino acid ABC transporter substrate-binding protein [Rhodospirillales bacterium]|nr:branched-chain amino acid ABC transporter substrate-binding protein [Rhodospirillales bacterium]
MLAKMFAPDASAADARIAYLDRAGDPGYRTPLTYAGLYRKAKASPYPAAELAIKDTAAAARAAGLDLALERKTLKEGEDAAAAIRDLLRAGPLIAAVLDLPLGEAEAAANALAKDGPILINARHREDDLRVAACRSRLLHVLPSWSMYMDALAQGLLAAGWRDVLVLQGPEKEDRRIASTFLSSAKKFGLRIVATRDFVFGNDPRKRDQINIRLLTSNAEYDVVFVADESGDFARNVPYNTQKPRPVVGAAGLMAHAWHAFWERHGAPQLNRRFAKAAGRPMTDEDWATWVGVRMIATAIIDSREHDGEKLMEALTGPAIRLELYKGVPGSIRPWSRQLRQAMLLATHDAVIGAAPVEGALHRKNNLDTLGPDEAEFRCPS